MNITDLTLMEQLRITTREIAQRKEYLNFNEEDIQTLLKIRPIIAEHIEEIVEEFYQQILPYDEITRIIGDAETLHRLKNFQRNYILTLFDGHYGEDYVHSRLRIGLVHKRIGVEPKYYVSAVRNLSSILRSMISRHSVSKCDICLDVMGSLEKIVMFDLALVFDTYISSLMEEAKISKGELEKYSESLEETVAARTKQLKEQARIDGLTNLLNQHSFYEELRKELSRSQRRNHPLTLIYFDLDGFKRLNDTEGHQRGDEILAAVAKSLKSSVRDFDIAARYGGDEFCVIMPECTTEDAIIACDRISDKIKEAVEGSSVTCSIGLATSTPEKFIDANSLVKMADGAMYEAKKETGFCIKTAGNI